MNYPVLQESTVIFNYSKGRDYTQVRVGVQDGIHVAAYSYQVGCSGGGFAPGRKWGEYSSEAAGQTAMLNELIKRFTEVTQEEPNAKAFADKAIKAMNDRLKELQPPALPDVSIVDAFAWFEPELRKLKERTNYQNEVNWLRSRWYEACGYTGNMSPGDWALAHARELMFPMVYKIFAEQFKAPGRIEVQSAEQPAAPAPAPEPAPADQPEPAVVPATQTESAVVPHQPAPAVIKERGYPGAKSNSGIIQWLINRMPAHSVYMELFAGSAQLFRAKRPPSRGSFLVDLDNGVLGKLQAKYPERIQMRDYLRYHCTDAVSFMKDRYDYTGCFIYLDPPYPASSRRSSTKLYKNEMTDKDHLELLEIIRGIPADIMISTRQNELYDRVLHDWRKEEFNTVTHGAHPVVEVIYMNYKAPEFLHQYEHLGNGYVDRQRVKRKITRFADKLQELPLYERHLFIQELIKADSTAVQHFLNQVP